MITFDSQQAYICPKHSVPLYIDHRDSEQTEFYVLRCPRDECDYWLDLLFDKESGELLAWVDSIAEAMANESGESYKG